MRRMRDLPAAERPREKMRARGPESLSDVELIAVLLGKGSRDSDVLAVAERALRLFDKSHNAMALDALVKIDGIGEAKACVLAAAMEFGRRRIRPYGVKISQPTDLLPLIRHYADRPQEHLLCMSLNGAHEVIATRVVTVGLVDVTAVHPREVFAAPITDRAACIVLAHNHPTGTVQPSAEDAHITREIRAAGDVLGIALLDHIIFSFDKHYSFREAGDWD